MKKAIHIISILLVFVLEVCNRNNHKFEENIKNSSLVKEKMEKGKVIKIMGMPDIIIEQKYYYSTNLDSYPYIVILFDSSEHVLIKYSPETIER